MTTVIPAAGTLTAFPFFGGVEPYPEVESNPRRTITVKTPGWCDTFPAMSADDDDAVTFDLVRLLADGETIVSINSFSLTVADNCAATDADLAARIAGVATIDETTVSQRFGNWQDDVPFIKYLVTAELTTSLCPNLVVKGYLPVWM